MWYDDKGSVRGLKALGRHDGVIEALKDPEISDRLSQLIARETGISNVFARILYRQLLVRLVGLVSTLVDNAVQARLDNVLYRVLSRIPGGSVTARILRIIDLTLASALADAQAEKGLRESLLSRLPVRASEDLSREGLEFSALAEILKLSQAVLKHVNIGPPLIRPDPNRSETVAPQQAEHYAYRYRQADFRGRAPELKRIEKFLDDDRPFRWLLVTGVSGMGKSRLLWESCLRVRAGWDGGFLDSVRLSGWLEHTGHWQPLEPTMMVLDYVVGQEDHAKALLSALCARSDLLFPVRLVLIERASSDTDPFAGGAAEQSWAGTLHGSANEWYVTRKAYAGHVYLPPLKSRDLGELFEQYNTSLAALQGELARVDPRQTTLMALLLAGIGKHGSRSALVEEVVIQHDYKKRFTSEFQKNNLGSEAMKPMLAALYIVAPASLDELGELTPPRHQRPAIFKAFGSLGLAHDKGRAGTPRRWRALEPDLFAEYFVLHTIIDGLLTQPYITTLWQTHPDRVFAFTLRCMENFAQEEDLAPALADLWAPADPDTQARLLFESLANAVSENRIEGARRNYDALRACAQRQDTPEIWLSYAKGAVNLRAGTNDPSFVYYCRSAISHALKLIEAGPEHRQVSLEECVGLMGWMSRSGVSDWQELAAKYWPQIKALSERLQKKGVGKTHTTDNSEERGFRKQDLS